MFFDAIIKGIRLKFNFKLFILAYRNAIDVRILAACGLVKFPY